MVKRNSLFEKMSRNSGAIIFGILSGAGLFFLSLAFISLVVYVLPFLGKYFTIIYLITHLSILVGTAKMYTKGLFRAVYIISSLILSLIAILT